jgi:hypothetical protein
MKTIIALAALLLPQESGSITGTTRVNRDGTANAILDIAVPLPSGAILDVEARLARHLFEPQRHDRLTAGQFHPVLQPIRVALKEKKARVVIDLPTPGFYEFSASFSAAGQVNNARFKDLAIPAIDPLRAVAGDPDALLRALFDDNEGARRHITACLTLFDRLEKEALDPERTLKLLEDIHREQQACMKESARTLLNATFEFVAAILADLDTVREKYAELLRQQKRDAQNGPDKPAAKDKPKDVHDGDPASTRISSGATGQPLSLDGLRALIARADALRIRETLSWSGQFARLAMSSDNTEATSALLASGIRSLAEDPSKARRELFAAWDAGSARLAPLLVKRDVRELTATLDAIANRVVGGDE